MPATALKISDLAGKAVLVTGASTGIGAALVEAYVGQGCQVGLHYNSSRDAAMALSARLNDDGGAVFPVRGDFSVSADVARAVTETAEHFGQLDGLINNAGGMLGRVPYAEMTDEHYDAVMDLNARSVIDRQPRRHPVAEEAGRLHHQHLLDRRAQRRRRWRGALRLGQGLRLECHARHGQGTDRPSASASTRSRRA